MLAIRTYSCLTLALAAGIACGCAPGARAAQPAKAAAFLDSLGVATHLNYTDGSYSDYNSVIMDLAYLGIHRLRDATPDPYGGTPYLDYLTALDAVADAGNSFDFITWPKLGLKANLEQLDQFERLHPGSIIAVEGPNETNNNPVTYGDQQGTDAALAYQRDLYQAVHGSDLLHGIPVYYYTGLDVATTLTGLADFANCHPYSYQGEQPAARIASDFGKHFTMTGSYPKVITEAGFSDVPFAANGVDDATQAKDTLNLYLDGFAQGVSTTFVYQLVSAYPNQGGDTQSGMFRIDHSPKPVATAIHNMTAILGDDGHGTASLAALGYSVAAMPATGHSLLLEKSSGEFDIILWSEPANWNDAAHQPLSVAPTPVTITLRDRAGDIAVYDPMAGPYPVEQRRHVRQLAVVLTDHPVIVEVLPAGHRVMTVENIEGDTSGATN